MLEVLEAGPPATVQDLGRPGWAHLGVPPDGACDPWSSAIANLLVGNPPDAATLELTFAGPRLRAVRSVRVALGGADLRARVEPAGRRLGPGAPIDLAPGDELVIPGPIARGAGCRAYLAVAGGLDVPPVLGSRSTCLAGGFGGLDGRVLRVGDRLPVGRDHSPEASPIGSLPAWPLEPIAPRRHDSHGRLVVRITPGQDEHAVAHVAAGTWTVAGESDRMGIRLEGSDAPSAGTRHVTSHGVVRGTVQLPPDGRPIVLLAAHQPTGGYPVAGVTIAADLPALGQLAPGDEVRFELVDLAAARAALEAQRAAWDAAVDVLHADRSWHELWHSAGG